MVDAGYPVQFSVDYPDRPLDRLTTLFRIFVVIPIAQIGVWDLSLRRTRTWWRSTSSSASRSSAEAGRAATKMASMSDRRQT
jgi:hypothetical protein